MKDANGVEVYAGDKIIFTYGIPPVGITAKVYVSDFRDLCIECEGNHKPKNMRLINLSKHVGEWYKKPTEGE